MSGRKTARITHNCLNAVKKQADRIDIIKMCLRLARIEFKQNRKDRKIHIRPPFEVFRDINTNDIVVNQWR